MNTSVRLQGNHHLGEVTAGGGSNVPPPVTPKPNAQSSDHASYFRIHGKYRSPSLALSVEKLKEGDVVDLLYRGFDIRPPSEILKHVGNRCKKCNTKPGTDNFRIEVNRVDELLYQPAAPVVG